MKAVQLLEHGSPGRFRFGDVPDPKPGPDEVVVEVRACGLNHLDLWLEEDGLPIPITLPRIPGGEISGVIHEVGTTVAEWRPGTRVAIQSNLFCGQCEFCLKRQESLCLRGIMLGVQRDGGFAERVAVPQRSLVVLPDGVDYPTSAALTLAGSTAMHMLTDRTQVQAGDWVLVMAAGSGVGSVALQIAKHLGAKVIATGSTPEKRELALHLGADHALDLNEPHWTKEVRRMTGKRGVDIVVEHLGGQVLEQVFSCLARGGRVVTCGATLGSRVQLDVWPLFVKQQQLIGSYGRNRSDMAKTLAWAEKGWIQPVIDRTVPLSHAADAFAWLRNRTVRGKIVVTTEG